MSWPCPLINICHFLPLFPLPLPPPPPPPSDVMTLPTLKQYIYYSFAVPEPGEASDGAGSRDGSMLMEAMMNVTQATFVTLQTAPTLDSGIFSKGHQTFFTLFSRYFKETMKVLLAWGGYFEEGWWVMEGWVSNRVMGRDRGNDREGWVGNGGGWVIGRDGWAMEGWVGSRDGLVVEGWVGNGGMGG